MFHPSKPATVLLLVVLLIAETQGQDPFPSSCGGDCPFYKTCVSAQGNRSEKSVQPGSTFHALRVVDCLHVQVQQGNDSVRFEADQAFLPYLEAEIRQETLNVRVKGNAYLECPPAGCNIKAIINAQYLDNIQVIGAAKVVTLSNFESRDSFRAQVLGGGELTLTAQAPNSVSLKVIRNGNLTSLTNSNRLHAQILAGGNAQISASASVLLAEIKGAGKMLVVGANTTGAQSADFRIMGSGELDGRAFPAETAKATIMGSGDMWVGPSIQLDATSYGSGTVRYLGKTTVTKDIKGNGKVIQLDGSIGW